MTLLRTGIHGFHGPGFVPLSDMINGALGGPPWWNPDGATPGAGGGGSCVGAYRAIDTPGSIWGSGPANYADSLINLANPGVNNLVEGNGAVPWAALTGWGFVAAAAQYLLTGIFPDSGYSLLIQYSTLDTTSGFSVVCGATSTVPVRRFYVGVSAPNTLYGHGAILSVVPVHPNGNLGMAGLVAYRDGINDGALGAFAPILTNDIWIGCLDNGGVAAALSTVNIESLAIYNVTLTAPQVLARAQAMAAL